MSREEILQKAFKQRYNREVTINIIKEKKDFITLSILSPLGKIYTITEHRKEGLTNYVIVSCDGKDYRYNRYVDGELHIADKIGEEYGDSN